MDNICFKLWGQRVYPKSHQDTELMSCVMDGITNEGQKQHELGLFEILPTLDLQLYVLLRAEINKDG